MKKIFIMSLGRTGSTYLTAHFQNYLYNKKSKVYNAHEFFRFWPMHFYKHIHFLKAYDLEIPKSFVDFMCNLVKFTEGSGKQPEKWEWVAPETRPYGRKQVDLLNIRQKKDGYYIHDEWPYSLNMIDDFCEQISKVQGLEYFIHKHIGRISEDFGDEWAYEKVIDKADLVIVNYRYSILDTFISLSKAKQSQEWVSVGNYKPEYDNKIEWSKKYFIDYATNRYMASYNKVKEALKTTQKPHFVIQYENFVANLNKRQYLADLLLESGVVKSSEIDYLLALLRPRIIKQSKPREFYEDCFNAQGVKKFKEDYHDIKHLTTYTY
tara:strand:- start:818 stop:1783 length:966 start_codon:yes stop_codon:yes gene_type:complete